MQHLGEAAPGVASPTAQFCTQTGVLPEHASNSPFKTGNREQDVAEGGVPSCSIVHTPPTIMSMMPIVVTRYRAEADVPPAGRAVGLKDERSVALPASWHQEAPDDFVPIAAQMGIENAVPASNPWHQEAPDDFVPIDAGKSCMLATNVWHHEALDDLETSADKESDDEYDNIIPQDEKEKLLLIQLQAKRLHEIRLASATQQHFADSMRVAFKATALGRPPSPSAGKVSMVAAAAANRFMPLKYGKAAGQHCAATSAIPERQAPVCFNDDVSSTALMSTKPNSKAYFYFIKAAILTLKERGGSSRQAINKFVRTKKGAGFKVAVFNKALRTLVGAKKLVQVKGSYKLAAAVKKAATKKTWKKAATKKMAVPKKQANQPTKKTNDGWSNCTQFENANKQPGETKSEDDEIESAVGACNRAVLVEQICNTVAISSGSAILLAAACGTGSLPLHARTLAIGSAAAMVIATVHTGLSEMMR
jgi:hypothetical protein